ncbi:MAG: hypothetical protein ACFB10_00565 [Salibacteraceae bacterium]
MSDLNSIVQYRQGDILLERIDDLPEGTPTTERLLAEGEASNHGHFIQGDVKVLVAEEGSSTENGGFVTHFLEVDAEAALEHLLIDSGIWTEEHHKIAVPPGRYRVIRQREYNPYARAIRLIKD